MQIVGLSENLHQLSQENGIQQYCLVLKKEVGHILGGPLNFELEDTRVI